MVHNSGAFVTRKHKLIIILIIKFVIFYILGHMKMLTNATSTYR